MARIAVIIPCHDDGSLLRDALASIREHEPIEIVVVDDGSSDHSTLTVLDELESAGVKVVRRPQGGPPAARNTGLAASSAPLVLPLDSDDALLPGALGALGDALECEPGAAFSWGDYAVFGDYEGRHRTPARFLPWTLTYLNPYPISSMFRREALEEAGGWSWDGRVGYEDWGLWLALVERSRRGVRVEHVVYRRRLHGGERVQRHARRNHRALYRQLRALRSEAFGRQAELRREEAPAIWKRVAYPVIYGSRPLLSPRLEAWLKRQILRRGIRFFG